MARNKPECDNPKVDIPLYFGGLCLATAIILFVIGGNEFRREYPKEKNYHQSHCLILTNRYRNQTCKGKNYQYTCYSVVWKVQHRTNVLINAIVESGRRHKCINETLTEAANYQVHASMITQMSHR
jgi:hypothetical protein